MKFRVHDLFGGISWHGRPARVSTLLDRPRRAGARRPCHDMAETAMPRSPNASRTLKIWVACVVVALFTGSAMAQEKKKEESNPLPRIATVTPFIAFRGEKTTVQIRGLNLADATSVRVESTDGPLECTIKSKDKIESPKRAKVPKVGDSQIAVEINLPEEGTANRLSLVVVTAAGETAPQSLVILRKGLVVDEIEPNGGFREAQEIERGKTIRGGIEDPTDVDVFKFHGKAGEAIVAEVFAARYGSALDSLLTLYNEKGNWVGNNDDSEAGRDSILKIKLPADGIYFLCLSDAQGAGGPTYGYLLTLRIADANTHPTTSLK